MDISIAGAVERSSRKTPFAPWRTPSSIAAVALLLFQPILFYWPVLVNPSEHIPYDIEGFHLPLISYVAECVRNGVAPLWDPYVSCGAPIHADLQAQVFYPFTWLAILAGNLTHGRNLYYWVECLVPLHMAMAGLFTFLLLRRMGLSKPAALLGASIYQLGGYFASQAQHLCAICTGAWLPLVILAVYELRLGFRARWFAALAVAVALSVLSGFAATAIIVGVAAWLVVAALLAMREASWRIIPPVAAGFLMGAAIAAVELVPLWTLTGLSLASLRAEWFGLGGGLSPKVLVSLVFPDYYHIFEYPELYREPGTFTFLYAYCGIAALILIAVAPFVRTARAIAFLVLTIAGALWMLGENTPVYRFVFTHLPKLLRGALYAEYALMAFCFFAAITAAVVLDRLGTRLPRSLQRREALLWGIALFTSYDLIHTGAHRPMNSARGPYRGLPYQIENNGLADRLRALANRTTPPSRVDYTDARFSPGILGPGMLHVPTSDSNNPFVLLRMLHLRHLFTDGPPGERELLVSHFDSPVLKMLNVSTLAGWLAIPPDQVAKAGLETLPPAKWLHLYRNPRALPRFFLAPYVRSSKNEAETLKLLAQPSFDPAAEAIVEGIPADRDSLGAGEVKVDRYQANRVELSVTANGPAFLASSEVMYPGWVATVNGAPQPLLMTNGAFRGLSLPAGASRVVMEYRPVSLLVSLLFSAAAFLVTLTVGLVPRRGRPAVNVPATQAWGEAPRALERLRERCVAAMVTRRADIRWLGWLLLATGAFYWKIVLTSQFSLLTGAETVNRSYSRLQFWIFSIRHGNLPLWDSYTHGGELAAVVFYPLHLLLALAPLGPDGLFSPHLYHVWFVFAHFLEACFLFALAREFGLGRFSALLGALCFSLGGFVAGTGDLSLLESGVWLPLIFLFLLRATRAEGLRPAVWNAGMSGLALGMSILAGGADVAWMQALAIASAALLGAKSRQRGALLTGVAVSAGLAAGAMQWLPWLEYGRRTVTASGGELWPQSLVAMILPGAFGGAAGGEAVNPYMGVLPLVLAVIAVWKNWGNFWVRYLAGLAVAAFLFSLGSLSLLHGLLSWLLPAGWLQVASRSIYLADFSAAVLAAFGAEIVLTGAFDAKDGRAIDRVLVAVMSVTGAGLLFAAASGASVNPKIAMSLVLIALTYGVFRYAMRRPAAGRSMQLSKGLQVAMAALVLFDLNAFESLMRNRQAANAGGANQLDLLLTLRGPAQFLKWMQEPFRVENDTGVPHNPPLNVGDGFQVPTVDTGEDGAGLLDARYRLMPASSSSTGTVIYQDAFWKICEGDAYPRAWMVHETVFAASEEAQRARLRAPGFDARQTAAIDGSVTLQPAVKGMQDWVNYLKTEGNRLEFEVNAKSTGLLVLSERFAPGWHATVNGSRTAIYRADGDLRAVVLRSGDNHVILEYASWWYYAGVMLTLLAFGCPLIPGVRRRWKT